MRRLSARLKALPMLAALVLPATEAPAPAGLDGARGCPAVARPQVPGARILTVAVAGHPGGVAFLSDGGHLVTGVPAFCDVTVVLTHPGAGDRVRVRLWLPRTRWNGRFQAVGGGGFSAGGSERTLIPAIRGGYAAASTDAGDRTASSGRPDWALDPDGTVNEGLLTNFAYRSVHEMSIVGKQVTAGFYGRPAAYSYWNGCSTGGRQGLMEAQRYPSDFDGIVAAAPAINWDRLTVAQFWPQVVMHDAGVYPTACAFDAFNRAAISACDAEDGVTDGIIGRPERCAFDPGTLVGRTIVCHGRRVRIGQADADIVRKIWDGPRSTSGRQLWYGLLRGTPFTPLAATTKSPFGPRHGAPFPVADNWIKYFLEQRPGFDTSTIGHVGFERLFQRSRARYHAVMGTDDPDLSAFRAAGGKLITWQGLADRVVFPQGTIDYRRRVEAFMGGADATDRFYRVFLAPGVGHCGGGPGPVPIDPLAALVDWVEHGHAPDRLPAATTGAMGRNTTTTDLCRYPQVC
ncbi:tannase/feruloyl esterase family alpha/beta hydrolase [Dactylosporangium sp. NPDC048998]|uniref:tannase/feruloyl esterase family alpha/beta hydrolase n=1 Tax=Dactylosporangium sp. NPDC048998 TaxID=3363976 RepID=UPI00371D71E9